MKFIKISSCDNCPHHKTAKVYTPDSFENVWSVSCTKTWSICAGYKEDWDKPTTIPDNCPLDEIPN